MIKRTEQKRYRISGHESFPCRYAWLPKVVRLLQRDPSIFKEDDDAMVELGLGKNMVRSARFWAQATEVISVARKKMSLTPFGHTVFGNNELDPFLEDIRTLWLLHWNLSTGSEPPLLAWDYLFNQSIEPEMTPSVVTRMLLTEASRYDDGLSIVTIQQHFDVFLHTYLPTRRKKDKVQEDNLDCPLVELELIRRVRERESVRIKEDREPVYAFRYEDKPDITPELFAYCIADYWTKRFRNENTLPFRDIAHGPGSPGRVFKLTEDAIRTRLEGIASMSLGCFTYTESTQFQQLQRTGKAIALLTFLKKVYSGEASHV